MRGGGRLLFGVGLHAFKVSLRRARQGGKRAHQSGLGNGVEEHNRQKRTKTQPLQKAVGDGRRSGGIRHDSPFIFLGRICGGHLRRRGSGRTSQAQTRRFVAALFRIRRISQGKRTRRQKRIPQAVAGCNLIVGRNCLLSRHNFRLSGVHFVGEGVRARLHKYRRACQRTVHRRKGKPVRQSGVVVLRRGCRRVQKTCKHSQSAL